MIKNSLHWLFRYNGTQLHRSLSVPATGNDELETSLERLVWKTSDSTAYILCYNYIFSCMYASDVTLVNGKRLPWQKLKAFRQRQVMLIFTSKKTSGWKTLAVKKGWKLQNQYNVAVGIPENWNTLYQPNYHIFCCIKLPCPNAALLLTTRSDVNPYVIINREI